MDQKEIYNGLNKYLVDLVAAGLEGNSSRAQVIALSLARSISKDLPTVAKSINEAISIYSLKGSAGMRSAGINPPPIDTDSQLDMATVIVPDANLKPILNPDTKERIDSFLEERKNIAVLIEKHIKPSNSLLLIGQPGTGKTMLAHYIASVLDKHLIILDLSASVSSLLGKTGHNLKKVLQYAKRTSSVLLLDEFDAIAKRRDDNTDLGEIKRVVNVLLMELEDWPISSVLIATSNHPELLDRAIWRRFDHAIEIPLPELEERYKLLTENLKDFFEQETELKSILYPMAELLAGKSAADICKFSNNVKRRIVLKKEDPIAACFYELELLTSDKKIKGRFCVLAKEILGDAITVREIAKITGLSTGGVQHHIAKTK